MDNLTIPSSASEMVIALPQNIRSDGLLGFLSVLSRANGEDDVDLDFSTLRQVSPAGMAAIAATVVKWRGKKRTFDLRI